MMKKHNEKSDSPRKLPFGLIKLITKNFSEELGSGAFAQVFKGVLEDGEEVAVKIPFLRADIDGEQFQNEFKILRRLNHPNIIRLVGFCDEEEEEPAEYEGKRIVGQRINRALCLEYMPNGSLGKFLTGENRGKSWWPERYKITKRICEGLKYLQEGLEFPIFHLDLKPDNILLDKYMIPHISDFGLSRLIGKENSKETLTPRGTLGYIPREFIDSQVISKEYDIYSLGVTIKEIVTQGILTGYSNLPDMAAEEFVEFVEHVLDNWKKCRQVWPNYNLAPELQQMKRCLEIARTCMEDDRHKRPTIMDIVSQLPKPEVATVLSHAADLLKLAGASEHDRPASARKHSARKHSARKHLLFRETVSRLKKQSATTNMHRDPPSELCHPAHLEHKLKLSTAAGAPFMCDGCKEPGFGPRYACDSMDLHTRCALAGDPLFGLHTLVLPLFGYGKRFEFRFLHHEAPSSSSSSAVEEGRTRVCDACGEPTRGFVYHCSEQGVDLHPCCASLPDRLLHGGRAFDLHRRASRPCPLCPENEGHRRWFWAYRRCNVDGDEAAAADLHVACLKETARRSWEQADHRDRPDVGDGGAQINVDGMLENTFGEVAGTLAGFITALVFGNMTVKV